MDNSQFETLGGEITFPDEMRVYEKDTTGGTSGPLVTFHEECFTADKMLRPEVARYVVALQKGHDTMKDAPNNTDDVIDSRDVIARIEELTEQRDTFGATDEDEAEASIEEISGHAKRDQWDKENPEEKDELDALKRLAEEAEGYAPDWTHGETLIRDSYFTEYAQQLAEDIGAIKSDASWPATCIDWEQAARELKMDYTAVEFDGVTYWVR